MKCEKCTFYTKSDKTAGGRCKFKPKKAAFPDDSCNVRHTVDGISIAKFEPIPGKKPKSVTENMIGPDPDKVFP